MALATKKFNIVKKILNNSILNKNIIEIILIKYWKLLPKDKILLDWIDVNKLDWSNLCYNQRAIKLLQKNLDKVNWKILSQNPRAISILENNLDKIDWKELSTNIYGYPILKTYNHWNWRLLFDKIISL